MKAENQINAENYPILNSLMWFYSGEKLLTRKEALSIYERNGKMFNTFDMNEAEKCFFNDLILKEGNGIFLD